MGAIRVVVADDHPVWRSGLRHALGADFDVVAEVATAREAIAAVDNHGPDVVACDVFMPDGGGIAVVRARATRVPIVMVSSSEAERDVLECVVNGALGYLLKTTPEPELRAGLRAASKGEAVFSPGLAGLVLAEFRRLGKAAHQATALTDREREVLVLVAKGRSYRIIGEELFIAPKTVENHVRRILDKLHLTRRDELVRFAVDHGIDT